MLASLSPEEKTGQKTPLVKTPVSEMLQFAAALLPMDLPPVPASAQNVTQVQQLLHESSPLKCHSPMSGAETPIAQGHPVTDHRGSAYKPGGYTPAETHSTTVTPVVESTTPERSGPKQSTPESANGPVSHCGFEGPTVSPLKGSPTPQTPTTPRRSRIAAKFDIPLSPTPSDASN